MVCQCLSVNLRELNCSRVFKGEAAYGYCASKKERYYGFHGRTVLEVIGDYRGDTYREVYTVRFEEVIYVLHVFQKKAKRGLQHLKKTLI